MPGPFRQVRSPELLHRRDGQAVEGNLNVQRFHGAQGFRGYASGGGGA